MRQKAPWGWLEWALPAIGAPISALSLLLVVALLASGSAHAAPSISGSSGTWSHDGSVTISGSSFGSKSPAAPRIWDHGQHATLSAAGWAGWAPTTGPGNSNMAYSTGISSVVMPHARTTKYATGSHQGSNSSTGGNNVQLVMSITKSEGQIVYFNWYARLDPAWQSGFASPGDGNFKSFGYAENCCELINGTGTNWYSAAFLDPASSDAQYIITDDGPSLQNPDANGDNAFHENMVSPGKGSASDASKWVKNEAITKITSATGPGGYIKIYDNGVLGLNYSGRTDIYSGTTRSVGVGGYARDQGFSTQRRFFADIYADTTASRVLLCAGSSYATRGICEPQIPTSWSSTSIGVTVNAGRFTNSSTAYLYVCDSTDSCNSSGTSIVIASGGGDTTPPTGVAITAPSNGTTVSGNWTVSASCSDNVLVQGVQMLLDGSALGAQDTSSPYSILWNTTGASNGSHTLSARCTDTSGNATTSSTINVTVSNVDATPPVLSDGAPVGVLPYGTTSTNLTLNTDENATCKYGTSAGVAYASQPTTFTTTGATSHSTSVSSLTNGGNYTYYVRCMDGASNPNTSDYTIQFSVSNTAAPVVKNECSSPPAGTIFCEDFDTGSTTDANRRAKWDDYDGATDVNFPVDAGPSGDGTNHVAQFRVAAGVSGAADLVKVLASSYDKLYTRWYMKYETGFNFAAPLHGGGLALGSRDYLGNSGTRPSGSDFAYFGLQHQNTTPYNKGLYLYSYYPGMYQDCGPPGSCFGDSLPCIYDTGGGYCTIPSDRPPTPPPAVNENEWICVETMIDAGTTGATGTIELWQNGTSMGSFTNKNLRSTTALKIENLWLSLFHHDGTHSVAGQLFDNVVVGTQRIGCNAAVSDTTPPSTPGTPVCNATSSTGIGCSWTASTDDTAVTGYKLERRDVPAGGAFAQVASPSSPSWADTVPTTTQYEYRVRAYDAAGNNSSYSTASIVAAPTAPAGFHYGLNDPAFRTEGSSANRSTMLDYVQDLGATWFRMDMTHSQVEGTQGVYDWSIYDVRVPEIRARGIEPLITLSYSPAWNRDGSCASSNAAPTSIAPFAAFAAAAVQRYSLGTVEVWNEPNTNSFWCPGLDYATTYSNLLKAVYTSTKAVSPATRVLGSAGTYAADTYPSRLSARTFLTNLYADGARHYFDGVAVHPYSYPAIPNATNLSWSEMDDLSPSLRSIMTSNGDGLKELWATEWGAPTNGQAVSPLPVTEQSQANDFVLGGYAILAGKSWAGPSMFFRVRDPCTNTGDRECWFGLAANDWSPKPAYYQFKVLTGNGLPAPPSLQRIPR